MLGQSSEILAGVFGLLCNRKSSLPGLLEDVPGPYVYGP